MKSSDFPIGGDCLGLALGSRTACSRLRLRAAFSEALKTAQNVRFLRGVLFRGKELPVLNRAFMRGPDAAPKNPSSLVHPKVLLSGFMMAHEGGGDGVASRG
jgi:hypothetical protein